ncbi:hypothetical protein LCGC14_3155060, partial [marine sediment metagenome]
MKYAIILLFVLGISLVGINEVYAVEPPTIQITQVTTGESTNNPLIYNVTDRDDNIIHSISLKASYPVISDEYILEPNTEYFVIPLGNIDYQFNVGYCQKFINDTLIERNPQTNPFTLQNGETLRCDYIYQYISPTLNVIINTNVDNTFGFQIPVYKISKQVITNDGQSSSTVELYPNIEIIINSTAPTDYVLQDSSCVTDGTLTQGLTFYTGAHTNTVCTINYEIPLPEPTIPSQPMISPMFAPMISPQKVEPLTPIPVPPPLNVPSVTINTILDSIGGLTTFGYEITSTEPSINSSTMAAVTNFSIFFDLESGIEYTLTPISPT